MRTTWEETWLAVATAISRRSLCIGRQVGAVIVTSANRPVAVGYNGPPANLDRSTRCDSFCPRAVSKNRGESYGNCVSVHAEANALLFADRDQYAGGTIYVTNPCCWDCTKLVANSGVKRVVVIISEQDAHTDFSKSHDFLLQNGIVVDVISKESHHDNI